MKLHILKEKANALKAFAAFLGVLCAMLMIRNISAKCEEYEESRTVILQYDSIEKGEGSVTAEDLEKDIKHLANRGYAPVFVSDIARCINKEGELPKKAVALTFDSIDPKSVDKVEEILEKYGFKATITVSANEVEYASNSADDNTGYLRWKKIKELEKTGIFEFSCKGFSLDESGDGQQKQGESYEEYRERIILDVDKACELFTQNCGFEPYVFTYPKGTSSESFARILRHMGFCAGLTLEQGEVIISGRNVSNPMLLERIRRSSIKNLWQIFK